MARLGWDDVNIIERFKDAKGNHGIDDLPAAILVLADSVERAAWHLGVTHSDGQVNVPVSGDPSPATKPTKKAGKRKH